MSIDEIMILNVALDGPAIKAYLLAVNKLPRLASLTSVQPLRGHTMEFSPPPLLEGKEGSAALSPTMRFSRTGRFDTKGNSYSIKVTWLRFAHPGTAASRPRCSPARKN